MADWAELAQCRIEHDYRADFHPERSNSRGIDEAKAICRRCPVKVLCLDEAIRRNEHGIWGGTTEEEREKIRGWMLAAGASSVIEWRRQAGQTS